MIIFILSLYINMSVYVCIKVYMYKYIRIYIGAEAKPLLESCLSGGGKYV
jgi:hypothetical protein